MKNTSLSWSNPRSPGCAVERCVYAIGRQRVPPVLRTASDFARSRRMPVVLVAIADAAGLGAFAVAGALAGISASVPMPAVVVLAMLTANGGGVIRDLLADRVPLVLRAEINATAAGFGGAVVWLFDPVSTGGAAALGVAVTAAIRVAGIAFDLHLPVPGGRTRSE